LKISHSAHPVRQARRNDDNLGRHHLVLVIVSEPESQRVFGACARCSIFMCMARYRVSLLGADLAEHDPPVRDDPPRKRSVRALAGLALPTDGESLGFQNPQLAAFGRSPDLLRNEQKLGRAGNEL
jgi:hypothetical protein